jgi:hypothetical protein
MLTVERLEDRMAPSVNGVSLANFDVYSGGKGDAPLVQLYQGGTLQCQFFAFPATFTGGVQLAASDVNGDGVLDLVCGAGPGGGPELKVFDGRNLALISDTFAHPFTDMNGVSAWEMRGPFYTLDQVNRWLSALGMGNYGVTDLIALNRIPQELNTLSPGLWEALRAKGAAVVFVPGPGVSSYPPWASLADSPSNLGLPYRLADGATDGLLAVVVVSEVASPTFTYEVGHLLDFANGNLSAQSAWQSVWKEVNWLRIQDNGNAYANNAAEAFAEAFVRFETGNFSPLPVDAISYYFASVTRLEKVYE